MAQKQTKPQLIIDLKLHFRGKLYQLRLGQVLRWLVPLAIVIVHVLEVFRHDAT